LRVDIRTHKQLFVFGGTISLFKRSPQLLALGHSFPPPISILR
jgi:hypothetical protein